MSTVVKNPTPKNRFQETANNVQRHRDMIASPEFERAADFAMLNYTSRLAASISGDFNSMASMGLRMMGAKEFLQEMRLLAETPTATQTVPQDNLDHTK